MDLLGQMATFVRVVEAGSFSAAARSLRMSLPAVSRQIAALEGRLGAALVARSTRQQAITDHGQRYYEHCLRVLREVDAAEASVRDGNAVEGVLTISAPVTLGLERVMPHVPALLAKYPGLEIDFRFEDRVADLVGEGVDVAIRSAVQLPETTSLVARTLLVYRRVLVASPQYLEKHGEPTSVAALGRHNVLLHAGALATATTWHFRRGDEESAVSVSSSFRTNAVYALRSAALAGVGIANLPDWLVDEDITARRLKVLLRDFASVPITVSAVHRRELRGSARVRALLDHLAEAYATDASRASSHAGSRQRRTSTHRP